MRALPASLSSQLRLTTVMTLLVFSSQAWAVSTNAPYVDDARCDPIANRTLTDEIGLPSAGFPSGEALASSQIQTLQVVCGGNGITGDDFEVRITNLTPFAFDDVFFVADEGISIGNADGSVLGAADPQDAFRIDALGINPNLIAESGTLAGIWESGESWTFLVTDFGPGLGVVPIFGSVGVIGITGSASTASIVVGNPVPEPAALALLGVGVAALACARRRGNRR